MDDVLLLEILVDIKAEIAAIQQSLLTAEIPTLAQIGSLEDQQTERESLRNALLSKYPSLVPASSRSGGQETP